jgi:hypothetical protein
MAHQDDFIKTALRLPRALHASIREAAQLGGKSMNAEIIGRLQDSLRAELLDANRQQLEVMRGLIGRADAALRQAGEQLTGDPDDEARSRLRHEISVLRDLIKATRLGNG